MDFTGANQGSVMNAVWSEGRFGRGLIFDGKSYVDCGNGPTLNPADVLKESTVVVKGSIKGTCYLKETLS